MQKNNSTEGEAAVAALVRLAESHDATFGMVFRAHGASTREALMREREDAHGAAVQMGRRLGMRVVSS